MAIASAMGRESAGYADVVGVWGVWMWSCGCWWGSWAELLMQVPDLETTITHDAREIHLGRLWGAYTNALFGYWSVFRIDADVILESWMGSNYCHMHLHLIYPSKLQQRPEIPIHA